MERRAINPWTWQQAVGFVHAVETTGGEHLEAVLHGAGVSLAEVVRLNHYTTDVDALLGATSQLVERLTEAGCARQHPARRATPALPELLIEIEATAIA